MVHSFTETCTYLPYYVLRFKLLNSAEGLSSERSDIHRSQLVDTSTALRRRVLPWYEAQDKHMPSVSKLRNEVPSRGLAVKHPPIDAHNLSLWLPSDLGDGVECDDHLRLCEWELRKAQADEALSGMRDALSAEYAVKEAKLAYGQGVRAGTKSTNKIQDSRSLAEYHGRTYRRARKAMISLAAVLPSSITGDTLTNFPVLHPWEVQPLPSAELELGDGRKEVKLSWIWKSYGGGADTAESANDSMCYLTLISSF
jgi:hypothetical protein